MAEAQYSRVPDFSPSNPQWGSAYTRDGADGAVSADGAALVPYAPVESYVPAANWYTRDLAAAPTQTANVIQHSRPGPKEAPDAPRNWKQFLVLNNYFREKHGAPLIGWSSHAAQRAQIWANRLAQLDKSTLEEQSEFGQNVFVSCDQGQVSVNTATQLAVETWYAESKNYDQARGVVTRNTRNFVNMNFSEVTAVGAGVAKSKRGTIFVVANYYPKPPVPSED
jgi:hypothetical protein